MAQGYGGRRNGAAATVLGQTMLVSRPRLVESAGAYLAAWFRNRGVLRYPRKLPIANGCMYSSSGDVVSLNEPSTVVVVVLTARGVL